MNLRILHHRSIVVLSIVFFIFVFLFLEITIQVQVSSKNTQNNSTFLLNQIIRILRDNEQDNKDYEQELKEEYILRAKIVSYLLDNKSNKKITKDELVKISELVHVDEIHIFNTEGTIVYGNIPKYIGLNMKDGDQISYFLPMLRNKKLTMCQNMVPNTAESKYMMYAMVWSEDNQYLIQVGIEPYRLLEELKSSSITTVIHEVPVSEGVQVIVCEKENDIVIASTNTTLVGCELNEIGIYRPATNLYESKFFRASVLDVSNYCLFVELDDFLIGITQEARVVNREIIISVLIIFIYLLISGLLILFIVWSIGGKLHREQKRRLEEQDKSVRNLTNHLAVIEAISKETTDILLVDTETMQTSMLKANGKMRYYEDVINDQGQPYSKNWDMYIQKYVVSEDSIMLKEMTNMDVILKYLENSSEYICSYRAEYLGKLHNLQVRFTKYVDEESSKNYVIAGISSIDKVLEEQKKFEVLETEANTDKLTGFYNRRSYEEFANNHKDSPKEDNFVYIAMDVNCLKQTNDTLGHAAGDELLCGAAACMKQCFAPYGKIYRTGGDEFVALVYIEDEQLTSIINDFNSVTSSWTGDLVKNLSVSCGYVGKTEYPDASFNQLSKYADLRMYEAKSAFYSTKGIDRRGQQEAFDVMCATYTKILKINLADDSYHIIKVDQSEIDEKKGFRTTASEWLKCFALCDQVQQSDQKLYLETVELEHMKNHFNSGKTMLACYYKRRIEGVFKQVIMEIIPIKEYSKDKQIVFLYVKDIDNK